MYIVHTLKHGIIILLKRVSKDIKLYESMTNLCFERVFQERHQLPRIWSFCHSNRSFTCSHFDVNLDTCGHIYVLIDHKIYLAWQSFWDYLQNVLKTIRFFLKLPRRSTRLYSYNLYMKSCREYLNNILKTRDRMSSISETTLFAWSGYKVGFQFNFAIFSLIRWKLIAPLVFSLMIRSI